MKVVLSKKLSRFGNERYICVDDLDENKIIDDAQGYGYRTIQKAHAAYNFKHRTKEENARLSRMKQIVFDYLSTDNGKIVSENLDIMWFEQLKNGLSEEESKKEIYAYLDTIDFDFKGNNISKSSFISFVKKFH